MKIAALITVCEGELDIAREAIGSFIDSCRGADINVQIVDDASPSHVGNQLAAIYNGNGAQVNCYEWPHKLGFRGTSTRLFFGLSKIASSGKDYDLVIKIDPDTLMLRTDFLAFLETHCTSSYGLWGVQAPMRNPLKLLYTADLMPIGFQRRTRDGMIQKEWRFQRFLPTWWAGMGWKALFHGFRFRYTIGPIAIFGGKTIAALHERGYLSVDQSGRHGFLTSEDDVLMSVAVYAIGHPIFELRDLSPGWDYLRMSSKDVQAIADSHAYAAHPLAAHPFGMKVRAEVHQAVAAQQGLAAAQ